MDAKTVLYLGIGMAVLLLLGFCVAPSRSAALPVARQLPSGFGVMPRETKARLFGKERQPGGPPFKTSSSRLFGVAELPVMLVGLEG